MAISYLKTNPLNLKRFIAIVPAIDDVSFFIPLLKNGVIKGVKGYILAGEKDNFTKNTKDLCSEMEKVGFLYKLTVVEGLGHDFPSNFTFTSMKHWITWKRSNPIIFFYFKFIF